MTNEELNTRLYKRMFDEQERFKSELMNKPAKEIMNEAYELVIREDILLSMEENDLLDKQVRTLLISKHPLSDLFLAWEKHEGHHMEEIRDLIEEHADSKIRELAKQKDRDER